MTTTHTPTPRRQFELYISEITGGTSELHPNDYRRELDAVIAAECTEMLEALRAALLNLEVRGSPSSDAKIMLNLRTLIARIDKGDHQNDCDLCGQPVKVGNIHKHCADYEQASADKGD